MQSGYYILSVANAKKLPLELPVYHFRDWIGHFFKFVIR